MRLADDTCPFTKTIDHHYYAHEVDLGQSGTNVDVSLSLCGVRLEYYAPVGATFLPAVEK